MAVPARRIPVLIAFLAFAARDAAAAAPRPLDRARVHSLYQDGEFEKVMRELALYGKGACACTRDDSLFAEKYLAVVLAANPVTRELGRYHMHRLLDLAPRADLLDMYIGEEVDGVFEKVRKEHALRAADPAPKPAAQGRLPTAEAQSPPRRAATDPTASAPAARVATVPSAVPAPASAPAFAPAPVPLPSAAPASPAPASYSDAWARLPAVTSSRSSGAAKPAKPVGNASAPSAPRANAAPAPTASALAVRSLDAAASPKPPATFSLAARPKSLSPSGTAPRSRTASAKAKGYSPWDQIATPSAGAAIPAASMTASASATSNPHASRAARASAHQADAVPDSASGASRPAWKEPGLWIGGGAAIAAIAFTLWHSGSDGDDPAKAYAVPASLGK